MRELTMCVGFVVAGSFVGTVGVGAAQDIRPSMLPSVVVPPPTGTAIQLPPPIPNESATPPPPGFGVGVPVSPPKLIPRTEIGAEVRPPMPVLGAPVEEPDGPRMWLGFDYLLWRTKGNDVPPLVAAIVNGNQSVTLSDHEINRTRFSGFQFTAGYWFSMPRLWGFEANYSWFTTTEELTAFGSAPGSILGRPFVDPRTGRSGLFQLSTANGTARGLVLERTSFDSDNLELNGLARAVAFIGDEMHWIAGFRYWGLREELYVEGNSRSTTPTVISGSFDDFLTKNSFYGGQVGARTVFQFGRLSAILTAKLGVGAMVQESEINGGSSLLTATMRMDQARGFLANDANIGSSDRTRFAVLGDVSLGVGYRVLDSLSVTLGYNFVWVSSVVRPGGVIDPAVSPSQFPFVTTPSAGLIRPMSRFESESFWMHGLNLGLTLRF